MTTIYTKRLVLKELSLKDALDMYEYAKEPVVGHNAGWEPHKSAEESKEIIKMMIKAKDTLGIYLNNKLIGSLGIHFRDNKSYLGYALSRKYWYCGYMTEACRELLKYYFINKNNNIIYARTFMENVRSQNVLKKLGFQYLGDENIKTIHEEKLAFLYKLEKETFIKENKDDNFK